MDAASCECLGRAGDSQTALVLDYPRHVCYHFEATVWNGTQDKCSMSKEWPPDTSNDNDRHIGR